ncbi:hypothetical protein Hanom_Chr04g00330891 [Helianthus anomalus]
MELTSRMKMARFQTFWIQMRKNKPLDESRKTSQTQGRKWHFTLMFCMITCYYMSKYIHGCLDACDCFTIGHMATKTMLESHTSSAIVTVDGKPRGILTSKDILMRVIALGLSLESTIVEKVMTQNPECAAVDTPIVGSTAGIDNDAAHSMMQNFWDSAMSADDDSDTRRSGTDIGKVFFPSPTLPNTFAFKIQDRKETHSLTELITAILQRVGGEIDRNNLPQILDMVILATDSDLVVAAVEHAKSAGWKVWIKVASGMPRNRKGSSRAGGGLEHAHADAWASAYSSVAAGAALVAGLGVLAFLRRVTRVIANV